MIARWRSLVLAITPPVILAGVFFLVSYSGWTDQKHFIGWGDLFFPLDQANVLGKSLGLWWPDQLGSLSYSIGGVPVRATFAALQSMHVSAVVIQRIFLASSYAASTVAAYLLAIRLWHSWIAASVASVCYVCGILYAMAMPSPINAVTLVLMPLLSYLAIKATDSRAFIPLFSIVSVLLGFVAANPPTVVLIAAVVAVIWLITGMAERVAARHLAGTGAFLVGTAVAVNLWWLFAAALTISHETLVAKSYQDLTWTLRRDDFLDIVEQTAFWGFGYGNGPWAFLGTWYDTSTLLHVALAAAALIAFAAVALVQDPVQKRIVSGLAMLMAVNFFLEKGLHEPLPSVNAFLYEHLPLYWLFREPTKLSLVTALIVPLLSGATALALVRRMQASWAALGIISILGIALLTGYPLLTGREFHFHAPETRVAIPKYWQAAAQYLNAADPGTSRVLLLPTDYFYQVAYAWGLDSIDQIAETSFQAPVVRLIEDDNAYLANVDGARALRSLRHAIRAQDPQATKTLLQRLSIGFIVVRSDIVADGAGRNSALAEIRWLLHASGLTKEATFGPLSIFRVVHSDALEAPRFFIRSCLPAAIEVATAAQLPGDISVIHEDRQACLRDRVALGPIPAAQTHKGASQVQMGDLSNQTRSEILETGVVNVPRRFVFPLVTDIKTTGSMITIKAFAPRPTSAQVDVILNTVTPLGLLRLAGRGPRIRELGVLQWQHTPLQVGHNILTIESVEPLPGGAVATAEIGGFLDEELHARGVELGKPLVDVVALQGLSGLVEIIYALPDGTYLSSLLMAPPQGIDVRAAFEASIQRLERLRRVDAFPIRAVRVAVVLPWGTPRISSIGFVLSEPTPGFDGVTVRLVGGQVVVRFAGQRGSYIGRIEQNYSTPQSGALQQWWNEGRINANQQWVVMRQAYASEWSLTGSSQHTRADGFANAWYATNGGTHIASLGVRRAVEMLLTGGAAFLLIVILWGAARRRQT